LSFHISSSQLQKISINFEDAAVKGDRLFKSCLGDFKPLQLRQNFDLAFPISE